MDECISREKEQQEIISFYQTLGAGAVEEMTAWDSRLSWEIPILEDVLASCRPGPLLDVGCGQGRVALALARRGWNVHGIDLVQNLIDQAIISIAQEALPATFTCADVYDMDEQIGRFAGAFSMWGTIRHVLDPYRQVAFLETIRQRLVPGGLFLVDTLDEIQIDKARNICNELQSRSERGEDNIVVVTHRRTGCQVRAYCFDENSLRHLMARAGFRNLVRIPVAADPARLVIVGCV